jgi:Xaa-Pro dipeptidase
MSTTMTDRTAAVQAALAQEGFEGIVIASPPNMAYVSGFHANPHERLIAVVVPQEGPLRVVAPSLEEEAARRSVPGGSDVFAWRDEDGPRAALAGALEGLDGRIGIEKGYLTVAYHELVSSCMPGARLDDCGSLLGRLRIVKGEGEVGLVRRAARIVDTAVERLAAELRPGRTEAELAAEVAGFLREEGGDRLAFDPIVLTGPKSALPHGHPDSTPLADGDLVIVDAGVAVEGYCADITRTFVVGRVPTKRQRELFEVVRRAELAGLSAAVAGARCADVDRAARGVIEAAGLGGYFIHRTGHGLGLEVHEPPYLTGTNEELLEAGMIVTIEPGVYIEGYGGVRIEDDLVVRSDASDLLTQARIRLMP